MISSLPITLGSIYPNLQSWIAGRNPSKVLVVSDINTNKYCLPLIREALPPNTIHFVLEPGIDQHLEQVKTLDTAERVWTIMHQHAIDRHGLVLNLGGGVITDLGGFSAAVYKRGIPYASIPTSLLAMTDAAIGGKTGVDFLGLKNMLGVIVQPEHIFVDPTFLQTLPPRELVSGYAEMVKHALLGGPELRDSIGSMGHPLHAKPATLLSTLTQSIQTKISIVQADPMEKGLRKLLNFGHTIGHALESWFLNSPDPLTHGEAVAIGLITESYLMQSTQLEWLKIILGEAFQHRRIPESSFDTLWANALHDKKNIGSTVQIAVPGKNPFELQVMNIERRNFEKALRYYNNLANTR
jgi:3-dehydroquinate synthase